MEYVEGLHRKEEQGGLRPKILIIASVSIALIAVGIALFLFTQNRDLQRKAQSQGSAQVSNEEVIKKVSQAYDAPNEKPSVAQVADTSKLSSQPFFKNAEKGDYVLIYPNAKIALIYRLSTNKVVNIGPISTSQR